MSILHRTHDRDRVDDTDVVDRSDTDDSYIARRDRDPEIVERPDRDDVVIRERTWTFAPGQLISLIVGIGLVALGVVAMVRAGIDGSFATPTVEVLGFTHTAWLGLAEVGTGVLLILAGTGAWGRALSVLVGAAMMICGVLIGAATSSMPEELAVEEDFGWMLVLLGALVALAAMVLPVWRSRRLRRNGVDIDDDRELLTR
ncbi:MAG: hypothetical protein ACJ739_09200 [Acidimicrobiales bacterium]